VSKVKKPSLRLRNAKTEGERFNLFVAVRNELYAMEREGVIPVGTAAKYHPAKSMVRIAETPDVPLSLRLIALKELMPHYDMTAAEKARAAARGDGAPSIVIQIANWAALPGVAPRAAITAEVVDVEAAAHRINSASPTPAPSEPDYVEYQTSANPAVPPRVIRKIRIPRSDTNPFTGEPWVAKTPTPEPNTQTSFDVFKE
jgi:hypothetical protein